MMPDEERPHTRDLTPISSREPNAGGLLSRRGAPEIDESESPSIVPDSSPPRPHSGPRTIAEVRSRFASLGLVTLLTAICSCEWWAESSERGTWVGTRSLSETGPDLVFKLVSIAVARARRGCGLLVTEETWAGLGSGGEAVF